MCYDINVVKRITETKIQFNALSKPPMRIKLNILSMLLHLVKRSSSINCWSLLELVTVAYNRIAV